MRIYATIKKARREVNLERLKTEDFTAYNLAGISYPFAQEAARQYYDDLDPEDASGIRNIHLELDVDGTRIAAYNVEVQMVPEFIPVRVKESA